MINQRRLWQLAKHPLSPQQNSKEFSQFLKDSQHQSKHKHLINPKQYYLRLSVLLIIFQLQTAGTSLWFSLYFLIKSLYLFEIRIERYLIFDSMILFVYFLTLPYVLQVIPYYEYGCWIVSFVYFFGGFSQKYLVLQLITTNYSRLLNFLFLILFSLAKLNKEASFHKVLLAMDLWFFLIFNQFKYCLFTSAVIFIIYGICEIDKNLLHRKKQDKIQSQEVFSFILNSLHSLIPLSQEQF